jgi:hypothetical protein
MINVISSLVNVCLDGKKIFKSEKTKKYVFENFPKIGNDLFYILEKYTTFEDIYKNCLLVINDLFTYEKIISNLDEKENKESIVKILKTENTEILEISLEILEKMGKTTF